MAEPRLLGFAVGPFMVGSFALAAMVIGLAFCASRGRRDHWFIVARLFTITSGLTALYLFCESAVYTAMLLDENRWARIGYRLMTAVALPAGAGYWLLARRLLTRRPHGGDRRLTAAVVSIAAVAGIATLLPPPYGLLGPLRVEPAAAWAGPMPGIGALVYAILGGGVITYLAGTLLRGVLLRRRARWPAFRVAGLIGCLTAFHDLLRLMDIHLARMPLLWVGLGLMLGISFVLLARQYAGLTVHVEGRENEINRLRAGQIADAASGTFSRPMLENLLRKEVERLARGQAPGTGVLMVRVDNYDEIRSRLGDSTAEAVVSDLADVLDGCVREVDSVGRWGRDRFLILVHTPNAGCAEHVVRRIEAATDQDHYTPVAGLPLGLSTGYAQIRPGPGSGWRQVVQEAEQAARIAAASSG